MSSDKQPEIKGKRSLDGDLSEHTYDYQYEQNGETVHVGVHLEELETGQIITPTHWRIGDDSGDRAYFENVPIDDDDLPSAYLSFGEWPGVRLEAFDGAVLDSIPLPAKIARQLSHDEDALLDEHRVRLLPDRREMVKQELVDALGVDSFEDLGDDREHRVDDLMERRGYYNSSSQRRSSSSSSTRSTQD